MGLYFKRSSERRWTWSWQGASSASGEGSGGPERLTTHESRQNSDHREMWTLFRRHFDARAKTPATATPGSWFLRRNPSAAAYMYVASYLLERAQTHFSKIQKRPRDVWRRLAYERVRSTKHAVTQAIAVGLDADGIASTQGPDTARSPHITTPNNRDTRDCTCACHHVQRAAAPEMLTNFHGAACCKAHRKKSARQLREQRLLCVVNETKSANRKSSKSTAAWKRQQPFRRSKRREHNEKKT